MADSSLLVPLDLTDLEALRWLLIRLTERVEQQELEIAALKKKVE